MKIALLGDIWFSGKYSIDENKDVYQYFKKVADLLNTYDYVIGNLEAPFISNKNQKPALIKSACIASNEANVSLLKYLNISIVNLANNHLLDYGIKAYQNTKELLDKNSIQYFGIENKEVIIKNSHSKIALNGYCAYNSSPYGLLDKPRKYGINELSIPKIKSTLKRNVSLGYLNILSMHSGQEHVNYPSYEDINMAREFAKIAPYVYYGHHPHVLQGIEKVKDSLIAYSLGNFCFDDVYTSKSTKPLVVQSKNNKTSIILELEIIDNKIINHKAIPIFAGKNELEIGNNETLINLDNYSNKLKEEKVEYTKSRNQLISSFFQDRKKMRDIKWYLKRLNYKSAIMIYNAKMNKKKHYNCVTKHLKD